MNFSRVSNQQTVGRLLRLPLRLIAPTTRIRIVQGRLRGRWWIVGSSTHGCWLGSYEHDKQGLFSRAIRPGDVVFDIGAHVGFYTLLASALVGPRGKVFSFEPLPRNLKYLKQHLKLNHVRNVSVFEAAVCDRSGTAFFEENAESSMGGLSRSGGLRVQAVALDELVEQGLVPLPHCVKIDVEGAELSVLHGARRTLEDARPTIFLATHGSQVHRQCCDFLRALGYKLEPIGASTLEEADEVLATHEP